MKNYTKALFLLGMLAFLFQACHEEEEFTQGGNADTEEEEGTSPDDGTKPEAEDLKLTLDLTAAIIPDSEKADEKNGQALRYEFADTTQAVALLRCTGSKEVLLVPCRMVRSEKDRTRMSVLNLHVPLNGVKASPDNKWDLKLIAGGKWDEAGKRISFEEAADYAVTDRQTSLAMNRPYVSDWHPIPALEDGRFEESESGSVVLEVPVKSQGMVVAHHIGTCDIPSAAEISGLSLDARSLVFGGYYDLSDQKALSELGEQFAPEWKSFEADRNGENPQEPALHGLRLKNAYTVNPGDQGDKGFVYFWVMPSVEGNELVRVFADGVVTDQNGKFEGKEIFSHSVPVSSGSFLEINSTLVIEKKADGPILLKTKDDKTSLVANGQDKIEFWVEQDGKDVTAECKVYWQKEDIISKELKDRIFSTDKYGKYRFYAEKGDLRSDYITITAVQDESGNNLENGLLFCKNVSETSGWYDVNKTWQGDGLLCWAAAASNMLQWWLEDFQSKGHNIPETVPFGAGTRYSLRIFEEFFDCWVNYMHATDNGIRWFMEGGGNRWGTTDGASPTKKGYEADGGYFRGVLSPSEEQRLFNSEYVACYGAYSSWETESGVQNSDDVMRKKFTELVIRLLSEGVSTLSVDSHELTLWGCELKDGLVSRVFIANSDDGYTGLKSYDVVAREERLHLDKYPGKTRFPTQIIRMTALKAYSF